jgi:basic membrane protein A
MTRQLFWLLMLLIALLLLAACGGVLAQPESAAPVVEDTNDVEIVLAPAAQDTEKYGLIAGPIDDKGFNQLAWEGLQQAKDELGVEVAHLETLADAGNAAENIAQFIDEGYNGIITVGFDLAQPTRAASLANPDIPFISIDFPSQTAHDLGVLFSTDEPAFMAGYLAAGMSETGTVCTFGGAQVPPVLIFMVGFEHGVLYYNEQTGADVQVLGWQTDPAMGIGGEGTFTGNYTDQDAGRTVAEDFFDQGCDVVFPVAGGAGLGAGAAAQERSLAVIGVDADQTQTAPEYADVYLTSVLKRIDAVVFEAVRLIHEGTYEGGVNFIGTLTNNGVGLAPFHSFEDRVPQQLQDDLAQIEQGIMDGTISTGWPIMQRDGVGGGGAVVARLTPQMLLNAEYPNEFTQEGTAPLVDGEYREPAAPGSATETVVGLSDVVAFGDLDNDGFEDAAVVTITDPGGSGTFYTLVAVLDRRGQAVPVATAALGDRIVVDSLSIESGAVVVDLLTRGEDEPMAAEPTVPQSLTYQIQVSLAPVE